MQASNLLASRKGRFIAFGTLYISEGLPLGFAQTAMIMFMRLEGLPLDKIATFAALQMLPWGFKWAWAPLIDIVKLNRFGGRRVWILFLTAMMVVTLVAMALLDFAEYYPVLLWMVVLNSFFGATQDVAIDSLAVSTLEDDERGRANGLMFGGQYLGFALGGGGAVYASSHLGFNTSLLFVSGLLCMSWLFVYFFIFDPFAREAANVPGARQLARFLGALRSFINELYVGFVQSGSGPKLGLVFAIVPLGAMALAWAIQGTILVDFGLDEASLGQLAVLNAIAGGIGCVVGGALGDRFGRKKIIALLYTLTTVPTLFLAIKISTAGLAAVSVEEMYAAIILHGFLYGAATPLQVSIFMGMTNPVVAATHFTAYLAISNLAVSIGNFWQGIVAERSGYAMALYLDAAIVIVALCIIPFLKNREDRSTGTAPQSQPVASPG